MNKHKSIETVKSLMQNIDPTLTGDRYRELIGAGDMLLSSLFGLPNDLGCQSEQAMAWSAVFEALSKHFPSWHNLERTGMGSAVKAISIMADRNPDAIAKCADPIVEQNVELLRERSNFGVAKYGQNMTDSKLTHKQWLRHALEELLDGANYLQAALQQDDSKPVTHGVLKAKTPGEFVEYSPGLTVLQAEQLARNYRINWAGRMWRFDGGKIVYSD